MTCRICKIRKEVVSTGKNGQFTIGGSADALVRGWFQREKMVNSQYMTNAANAKLGGFNGKKWSIHNSRRAFPPPELGGFNGKKWSIHNLGGDGVAPGLGGFNGKKWSIHNEGRGLGRDEGGGFNGKKWSIHNSRPSPSSSRAVVSTGKNGQFTI